MRGFLCSCALCGSDAPWTEIRKTTHQALCKMIQADNLILPSADIARLTKAPYASRHHGHACNLVQRPVAGCQAAEGSRDESRAIKVLLRH